MDETDLPALDAANLPQIDVDLLAAPGDPRHPPRILLLYGALRSQSYSRKTVMEAERILKHLGSVILGLLKKIVKKIDANKFLTGDFEEAAEFCKNNQVDILITDLHLNDASGLSLIETSQKNQDNNNTVNIIMSAEPPREYRHFINELNINGWILKPVEPSSFTKMLKELVNK